MLNLKIYFCELMKKKTTLFLWKQCWIFVTIKTIYSSSFDESEPYLVTFLPASISMYIFCWENNMRIKMPAVKISQGKTQKYFNVLSIFLLNHISIKQTVLLRLNFHKRCWWILPSVDRLLITMCKIAKCL